MGEGGAEELASLDRLLTRLALTEDAQLEKVLSKLLPLAISRMASTHQPTKLKVMEMLNHINKRVKDQLSIKLPLKELLKLYWAPNADPMVRNFSIVYIEMGFEHASPEEQAEVVPELLSGIAKVRAQHQDIFLRMASKGLEKYSSGRIEDNLEKKFKFVKDSADCEVFLEFCLQTMLFQPPSLSQPGVPPPGLSSIQAARISGKDYPRGDQLVLRKLGLLNFIAELGLDAGQVYILFLVASVDSNERVAKRGDELLKRKASGANLEDPRLIKMLFSLYIGTTPSLPGSTPVEATTKVAPAGLALKVRLMGTFTRSVAAANQFPLTLQCVFDCISGPGTTLRLKQAGTEFSVWIFKHAEDRQLKVMAPLILTSVIKLLTGQEPNESDASSKQLRSFCYQAIGQLANRAPHLFSGSTEMVVRLFEALQIENVSLRSSVQEALTSLAVAYKGCSAQIAQDLEALLLRHAQAAEGEARFCSILWATKWNSFSHAPSRYLCMLGAADTKLDVREMAQQGLSPPKTDKAGVEVATVTHPSLKQMMDYICQQQPGVLATAPVGEQVLLFPPKTYVAMISFLQKCFEAENLQSLDNSQNEKQLSDSDSKEGFRLLLEHAMAHDGTVELHMIASKGLLGLAALDQQKVAETYKTRLSWLKQFVGHIDSATREAVGHLLGICTAALPSSDAADLLKELVASFEVDSKRRFEDLQGAVCATGYVLAQCMTGIPEVPRTLLESTISVLILKIRSANDFLAGSSAEALGHAGLRGPLPIKAGDLSLSTAPASASGSNSSDVVEGLMTTSKVEGVSSNTTTSGAEGEPARSDKKEGNVENQEASLALALKNIAGLLVCKEVKIVQKGVIALGHICYGDPKPELLDNCLSAIFTLSKSKAEDVLFSIGEALSFVWGGVPITADKILKTDFISLSSSTNFLNEDGPAQGDMEMDLGQDDSGREKARERIIKKLFDEMLFSGRADERCAGCVWLVSVISYSGRHARVQQMLPEIQDALSHLLGDQNDLTQEMASRGMSIVYELGDSDTKNELVMALVGNLSGTAKKKRAVKLMEDSEVFAEGALGEKPGGGNISTYKELCSIANEMGQPDLIYKFMDLANHQASLNSKRGAAFGFARIAKQAGEALKPHLRTLVPKLLRYQYDPNKRIQDAMGHIWRALVAEPKKTIDEFFDDIMEDLLTQAGSRLWRSRESSCLALADVLQGRRFSEVGKFLERVWTMAFRSIDDIKETVRLAGESLCRAVSSLTLRLCDTTLTAESDAKSTMAIVLPFLLSKGILSSVEDVRRISITTVMKLVKGAGQAVRPQMPDLVVCMLESLSSLEDQRLNYAELHAERVGISTDKLENVRIAVAKDSPMWDTLDLCLRQVDTPTLELLVPRLILLVRSGVGLNTRAGVARFISQLAQRVGLEVRPHSGALLKALFSAVKSEKSAAAKRAFAAACGAVVKFAGEAQIRWLLVESVGLYTSGADKDVQLASALVLEQISLQANEVLKGNYTLALPVAFVARFDEEKEISRRFEELWEENTSGGAALQLYMPEIVGILREGIGSSSWSQKKKTAKGTAYLAEKAGESVSASACLLLTDLLAELPGRLWEGKEAVLEAVGALAKFCHKAILSGSQTSNSPGPIELVTAISAACGRKKASYRTAAFISLEEVLKSYTDHDLLEQVTPFLVEECMKSTAPKPINDGSSVTESEEAKDSLAPLDKVMGCLAAGLQAAGPASILALGMSITTALTATMGPGHLWHIKMASLSTAKVFLEKIQSLLSSSSEGSPETTCATIKPWLESLVPPILECITTVKVLQVHTAALECLVKILEVGNLGSGFGKILTESLELRLQEAKVVEKNAAAMALISHALELSTNSVTPMQE